VIFVIIVVASLVMFAFEI